jgi:hypothetical protein
MRAITGDPGQGPGPLKKREGYKNMKNILLYWYYEHKAKVYGKKAHKAANPLNQSLYTRIYWYYFNKSAQVMKK